MNRKAHKTGRSLIVAGIVLALAQIAASPASAQQYHYRGVDATYPNIHMDLYLTAMPGGSWDATGSVYLGSSFNYIVKGSLSAAGTLSGRVTYPGGYRGTAVATGLGGALVGAPGTGTLTALTGFVPVSGSTGFAMLTFVMPGPGVGGTGGTGGTGGSTALTPADFRGSAGFGYTVVSINLHLQPNGGAYQVSGQITVRSIRPRNMTTVMQVSGTYRPGQNFAPFGLSGVPQGSGNNATFTGTMPDAKTFNCQLTNIRSLGIFNLYFRLKS